MIRRTFLFFFFYSCIFSYALADTRKEQLSTQLSEYYLKHYDFTLGNTFRGFIDVIPIWNKLLSPFKGKPDIQYLEIGVNEGRSAIWTLENILTHPSSKLTGIDLFPEFPEGFDLKKKYLSNLKLSGFAHKATTIKGFSQIELRRLPLNSFDIIYIDGDHKADGVLADAVLSFELLKPGGILIFDDYLWSKEQLPEELRPQIAIDSFITAYRNSIEVLHRGYQVFIRKRKSYCESLKFPPIGCTPIGQYVYVWNWNMKHELYYQGVGEPIKISDKEKLLIETLIRSTKFGNNKLFLTETMLKDENFIKLRKRLKLDLTNIAIEQERGFLGELKESLKFLLSRLRKKR